MTLQRRIRLMVVAVLLCLAYGFYDWDIGLLQSLRNSAPIRYAIVEGIDDKIQDNNNYSLNGDQIQETPLYANSKNTSSVETTNKAVDMKSKLAEINHVAAIISKLSNIKENSRVIQMVRKALFNIPQVPSLLPDLAENALRSKDFPSSTAIPPVAWVKYTDTWKGYTLPVLTCKPQGRLGNVMGEYATMYALRQFYNATMLVHKLMKSELRHFPKLSLPLLDSVFLNRSEWTTIGKDKSLYNYKAIELAAAGLLGPHHFVMQDFPLEVHLFQHFKKDLKREFEFSSELTSQVQEFLRGVAEKRRQAGYSDIVFVGFHIRRTDYAIHARNLFGAVLPEDGYFNRALDYYREKFPGKVAFIAASDDPTFLKNKLGKHPDVFFSPGGPASLDMSVLSSCNHSIVTLGSYGFWTGFLAGGEVVYPDTKFKNEYRFSRRNYEKIGLASFTPLPVD